MPRVGKSQMKKHKQPKGASKKAARQYAKKAGMPITKAYGKPVMKEDKNKPGRKIGYATVTKTKLPKYHGPKKKVK